MGFGRRVFLRTLVLSPCLSLTWKPKRFYVSDFGAVGDSVTDDTQALINAISSSAGHVLDWGGSDRIYKIVRPLLVPSFSKWVGSATIYNAYAGTNRMLTACIHLGNFHPAYFQDLNAMDVGYVRREINELDCGGELGVGDLVWIYSKAGYQRKKWLFPQSAQMMKVQSVKGNVVRFDRSVTSEIEDAKLASVAQTNLVGYLGNPLSICQYTSIDGLSLVSLNGPAMRRGGLFRSRCNFRSVSGTNGIYINAMCESEIIVGQLLCSRKFVDLAGNSHDSSVWIDKANYMLSRNSSKIALIAFNENSRNCHINISEFDSGDFNFSSPLAQINSAQDCSLRIFSGRAPQGTGNAFVFQLSPSIGVQNYCENNSIHLDYFELGPNYASAIKWNPGINSAHMRRCGVKRTQVFGGPFRSGNCIELDGTNSYITQKCYFQSGKLLVSANAESAFVRGRLEDGINSSSKLAGHDILVSR